MSSHEKQSSRQSAAQPSFALLKKTICKDTSGFIRGVIFGSSSLKKIMLTTIALLLTAALAAQQQEDQAGEKPQIGIAPLPVITYGSSTSLLFGAMLVLSFPDPENPDALSDMASVNANYTLKKQKLFTGDYTKYFGDDTIMYQGALGYKDFPSSFNGIGATNTWGQYEEFGQIIYYVDQAVLFRIESGSPAKLWLGPAYSFARVDYSDFEKGKALDKGEVPGSSDTTVSSPGVKFDYDTRDDSIYTSSGNYFTTSLFYNGKIFGATQNCAKLYLEYDHFFDLGAIDALGIRRKAFIVGVQGLTSTQGGDVPMYLMNAVGDDKTVRGYSGRFQDKCLAAAQIEIRYPIWWRFSGTVFAGAGNVSDTPFGYDLRYTRYAGGIGLRVAVIEQERINLRFDIAYNREGEFCPIMSIMEAF